MRVICFIVALVAGGKFATVLSYFCLMTAFSRDYERMFNKNIWTLTFDLY